jgi:hypothetical protein
MKGGKAKRKAKRKPPTDGYAWEFHGSFTNQAKARMRARARGGWVIPRHVIGQKDKRYIVVTSRVPF